MIVDASTGAQDFEGGLGAILTQMDKNGQFTVIAYASRLLTTVEQLFSPFLLEMRAMVWATRHFQDHLKGQRFILFTDHKPLQTCADALATKTLTDHQQLALEFDFVIQYKKGINTPADFLSRAGINMPADSSSLPGSNNVPVNVIQLTANDLARQQEADPEIQALIAFCASGRWPTTLAPVLVRAMAQLAPQFTTDIH